MAYLSKSRFKQALSCPTKLYYGTKGNNYADNNADDPFMMALAEGGYQVGELAKFLVCNDPVSENITINELDYEKSLAQTKEKREKGGSVVIAEAAFAYNDYFVRTDLFVEERDTIKIYEVKAKSWDEDVEFIKEVKRGPLKGTRQLDKEWREYLYDIAFQKYVVQKANPSKTVITYIVLADKTQNATIEGLNQLFKIKRKGKNIDVEVMPGIIAANLGQIPLKTINVDDVCDWIYSNKVDIELEHPNEEDWTFETLIEYLSKQYSSNKRIWSTKVGTKCKGCQYKNKEYPLGDKKSGLHDCWKHIANLTDAELTQPLVLELWGGLAGQKSFINDACADKRYLLKQVDETIVTRGAGKEEPIGDAIDPTKRRLIQIEKSKKQDFTPHIDKEGLKELFESLAAPYHFIDFETTMVALPFHKDRQPYEAIAFQYSYHLMDAKGNITHKSQYLNFKKGAFPNYDFLRHLKKDLSAIEGTIFRYHKHENTYLLHLYKQLYGVSIKEVPDKEELMAFIREITTPGDDTPGEKWLPTNNMQDLWDFVLKYFYSLHAKGSNSIKDILPAIIKSSSYLREKYSQPIYATATMPSLNLKEPHIWIDETKGSNPYKTLPAIFDEDALEEIEAEGNLSNLDNGGAAMIAYAYLQFADMTDPERELYRQALLRYCELDTMAMVMIWEYWGRELGRL
jgi:hypothetical protein